MTKTALKLKIDGMHCDACVRRVTASLQKLPSVHVDHVAVGEAELAFDPSSVQQQILNAIDSIGFHAEAVA